MPQLADPPSVSVALCTHNGSTYLAAQVESILAQSHPVREIVLSDDASSDDTVSIVSRAVMTHNKATPEAPVELRIIENAIALGVSRNFQQAVTATTGALIALCDQDDVWHPDRIETMVATFAEHPETELAFSDARLVDGNGTALRDSLFGALEMSRREKRGMRAGAAFEVLLGRNLVTGATVVFRRGLLDIALPFADHWVHDEWLAALAAAAGQVRMLPDELIDYRQHGGNQIGAARLSVAGKARRVGEPRAARNARLLARAEELVERLESLADSVPEAVRAEAQAKLAHETLRSRLPASRPRRLGPVLQELRTGGYSRYGRGVIDAARDLVQPAG